MYFLYYRWRRPDLCPWQVWSWRRRDNKLQWSDPRGYICTIWGISHKGLSLSCWYIDIPNVHTCMSTDVYSAVYKSTSYLFFILFEQMFGNTKENRHGSQSDYFNALKVRTFYKNWVMWSLRNNLFPIHFQRLCTMKYICFGAANVNIKFIEINVVYYSLFSKRLVVKTQ